jgi:predicted amidophosphoribosyltransferase
MIQDFIREHLSACARCRSLRGPIQIFCELCWELATDFRNDERSLRQSGYPFKVYSLYTWHDQFDSVIRPLIYALKGGCIQKPWPFLAQELIYRRSLIAWIAADAIVLPPRQNKLDHAWYWAKAIGDFLKVPILDCLESEARTQKRLSLSLRKNRQMNRTGEDVRGLKLIFVDDTITSGATALAAFTALGAPERFEVWTLVARPRHGIS